MISDAELIRRMPNTRIDHDNKELYRGWFDRQLRLNRCTDCGRWHHPPSPVCPACMSTSVKPTAVSGRGLVYLLARLHHGPSVEGVSYADGWPIATIELEEQVGLRFTTTVIACDRDTLRIDLAVKLSWIERDAAPFPVFRPAENRA